MKTVLVTGAGGAPAIGFTRSLRESPEKVRIIGVDVDKYNLQRAQADKAYLVPRNDDPDFLPVLGELVRREGVQFIHPQVSADVLPLSRVRDALARLGARTFLPQHEVIEVCEDKWLSHQVWQKAGLRVPGSMLVHDEEELGVAFSRFGPRLWLRETRGSGGRGALPTDSFELARAWIVSRGGWGRFQASEMLERATVTWQSIWDRGRLVVAQGRKRLSWEAGNRAPSGVTGITGTGVTVSDSEVDAISQEAILAIDPAPHGVYGVDLTYDKDGAPNPTEINSARFFTTHYFFTRAGLNMPYILMKLAFGETPPPLPRTVNPLPPGLAWVRGMDIEPVLRRLSEIDALDAEMAALQKDIASQRLALQGGAQTPP